MQAVEISDQRESDQPDHDGSNRLATVADDASLSPMIKSTNDQRGPEAKPENIGTGNRGRCVAFKDNYEPKPSPRPP